MQLIDRSIRIPLGSWSTTCWIRLHSGHNRFIRSSEKPEVSLITQAIHNNWGTWIILITVQSLITNSVLALMSVSVNTLVILLHGCGFDPRWDFLSEKKRKGIIRILGTFLNSKIIHFKIICINYRKVLE